jgi:hypothetical protein
MATTPPSQTEEKSAESFEIPALTTTIADVNAKAAEIRSKLAK